MGKLNLEIDPTEAEKMSVVDILEYTFGKPGNSCIRSQTGGWWAYEFCPGDFVRQFHEDEVSLLDLVGSQKKGAKGGVTEHYLGRFIPEDHEGVTKENEWEHVVNATSSSSKSPEPSATTNAGGNG